jgi:hypothetical protein
MSEKPFRQRKFMQALVIKHGGDQKKVCAAYAKAERDGLIIRSRDENDTSPEVYADLLWRDGVRWSWLKATP